MFKNILSVVLFLLIGMGCVLSSCSSASTKKNEGLVVGLQAGYPPYEYVDEKGEVIGFDVDIAQKIADQMGKKLVVKQMSFDSLILALKQKKIDVIISGMGITPTRLKEIAMVPYYGDQVTTVALLFWKEIPQGIETMENLSAYAPASVSVQSGNIEEELLRKYSFIAPKGLENAQELIMDIKYGKSMAALTQQDIGKELALKFPEIALLEISLPPEMQIYGSGIGIHKENKELIEKVQQCVDQMKQSGEMKAMHQKWFKGDQ